MLYLIEILHQTTTPFVHFHLASVLYLIEILHQTTTRPALPLLLLCCILSKFYIKPQHPFSSTAFCAVVSYRNSTSNHNYSSFIDNLMKLYLIEILHQTTTDTRTSSRSASLYLIEILHQTTTTNRAAVKNGRLYLIEILHQTTTLCLVVWICAVLYLIEILHQTTTYLAIISHQLLLYLIEILHQTTTKAFTCTPGIRCILSKFYIKPQQRIRHKIGHSVVSYRNSTSNHNGKLVL